MKWDMRFLKDFADILLRAAPLAPLTTFGIGGPAEYLFSPRDEDEYLRLASALASEGVPYRILGAGSNVLVGDRGVEGGVIRLTGVFDDVDFQGERAVVGAALPLGRLVGECVRRGLAGAECLAGIPASVGGALLMNAGGKWGRVAEIVESVTVATPSGQRRTLAAAEVEFGYRESSLRGSTVLSAGLRFKRSDPKETARRAADILAEKRRTQDLAARSAGCVFRNPPGGEPAGLLIEKAGLKGQRLGGAEVSRLHANFITNAGGATAADVIGLIDLVRKRVLEAAGIDLELEIELW